MSTNEIDSILTEVERLSTDEKKSLIKRVVDLLGEPPERLQPRRPRRRKATSISRHELNESIAAYAARHGGGSDRVDLDPELEAASVEYLLAADEVDTR